MWAKKHVALTIHTFFGLPHGDAARGFPPTAAIASLWVENDAIHRPYVSTTSPL